ncbi:DUF3598 family protein [Synechococcus elongatus]|uniref:DUF3598 domain-containing protein n=2 Tax=Synechococcus elongatus TaxID=32046 RepID=Q31QR3_SYNE7|nr:DUF3598 family protein [Synechococcus elongatus]ABB56606.1 conserved hypothetical protein [Synechococcus elongatus PCC 7942 = FACHB-805]AJD56354.1 hypothetical protein M744_00065 [Synechococcus elongatus UTEX 2973]MBD2588811.1 DUF3598 family protein [Synechococcus elongatus FACHB-242]MBD2689877.1 DUF3598 family protein [Synechococcus elongatus FACHB-1061]MBD2706848.1 DUF3598 family protein [Synechococcus elongatus PCC 7942 = FACHB-805]
MKSVWNCLLENVGEWRGSFTSLNLQGEILSEQPTVVTLSASADRQQAKIVVDYQQQPDRRVEIPFTSVSRAYLGFDDGAFSQGGMQLAPFGEFGAEQGLLADQQRRRLVWQYRDRQLQGLTLIREALPGIDAFQQAPLTVQDLLGTWSGIAETRYPDWRSPDRVTTQLRLEKVGNQLQSQLDWGDRTIESLAPIQGSQLVFVGKQQAVTIWLLPGGVSCACPTELALRSPFQLELGWLVSRDRRLRLIRSFDASGAWTSVTLITEQRLSDSSQVRV